MASRHTARDARTPGWYWSDNDLIDHYGPLIGAYGIAVYSALARYADRDGRSFPSYNKLAKQLHMSRMKVISTIKDLADYGLITIEQRLDARGDPASNEYTLTEIARQSQELDRGSTSRVPPSTPGRPQVVHHIDGGSTPGVSEEDSLNKTHDQPPPPTPSEPAGGGGGSKKKDLPTDSQKLLLGFGFSATTAREFRDLPTTVVERELEIARKSGAGPGALVERWRDNPPELPKVVPRAIPEPTRPSVAPDALSPQEVGALAMRLKAEIDKKKRENAHAA